MKKCLFLLGGMISTLSLFAQEATVGKSQFSIHAGPSWYLGKMIGITNHSDTYRNDLRDGVAWDVNYYYLGDKTSAIRLRSLPDSFTKAANIRTHMMEGRIKS